MTTTDLAEILATLEHNREERRALHDASSERIQALLRSARTNLDEAHAIREEWERTRMTDEEFRQGVERVRQIAQDLREGRY
jgi:hypothetical protein